MEIRQMVGTWGSLASRRVRLAMSRPVRSEPPPRNLDEMAHDLRGLVAAIKGYAQVLQEHGRRSGAVVEERYCDKILGSCNLLTELVSSLEQTQREQARQEDMVDVPSLLQECVSAFDGEAQRKAVKLRLAPAADLPPVQADRRGFIRVVCNLLSNALKYSPRGATVLLTACVRERQVQISVNDNGPGIHADELPLVFQSGWRGTALPTGGESRSGLGLAIVKKLVNAWGGEVEVRSQPGRGSCFSVSLPLPQERVELRRAAVP